MHTVNIVFEKHLRPEYAKNIKYALKIHKYTVFTLKNAVYAGCVELYSQNGKSLSIAFILNLLYNNSTKSEPVLFVGKQVK